MMNRCWTYETSIILGKEIKVCFGGEIPSRMNYRLPIIWSILGQIIHYRLLLGRFYEMI